MSPRPSIHNKYHTTDNQYWIELIYNNNGFNTPGVIIVGAMHANVMFMLLYEMYIHQKCTFYTIIRNIEKNQNELILYNPSMIRNSSTYNDHYTSLWSFRSIIAENKQR